MRFFERLFREEHLIAVIFFAAAFALLTPLVVSGDVHYAYTLPRVTIFHLLVEFMLIPWALLMLRNPEYRPSFKQPIVLGVTVATAALLFTIPFSTDPFRSFFSTANRTMGGVHYLHYYAWFLILATTIKSQQDWRKLLTVSGVVATVVAAFTVMEWELGIGVPRPFSTLGNPMFLGSYLLIHVFLACLLAVENIGFVRRAWCVSAFVMILAMLLAFGRGSLVGLVFGAIGFLLIRGGFSTSAVFRKRAAEVLLVVCLVLITTVVWVRSERGVGLLTTHVPFVAERLLGNATVVSRFQLWEMALHGFFERPLFGWGVEQFEMTFNQQVNSIQLYSELRERWYDRVHNEYLERLVTTGLVGTVGALLFIVLLSSDLLKRIRSSSEETRTSVALLTALFMAHGIELAFSFAMPSTQLVLFLLLAFLVFSERTSKPQSDRMPTSFPVIAIILFIVWIVMAFFGSVKPYLAMHHATTAARLVPSQIEKADRLFRQSFSSQMYSEEVLVLLTKSFQPFVQDPIALEHMESLVRLQASETQRGVERRPDDFRTHVLAAEAWLVLGRFDSSAYEMAEQFAKRAMEIAPSRFEGYGLLGRVALATGRSEQAVEYGRMALTYTVLPIDQAYLHVRIAEALLALRDIQGMYEELAVAEQLGYDIRTDVSFAVHLGEAFSAAGIDTAWAVDYIDHVWRYAPQNIGVVKARAAIRRAAGDTVTPFPEF